MNLKSLYDLGMGRGRETAKRSLVVLLIMAMLLMSQIGTTDSLPSWFKEGAYMEYSFDDINLIAMRTGPWIFNATGTYRWRIDRVFQNGSALLGISLNLTGMHVNFTESYLQGKLIAENVSLAMNISALVEEGTREAYVNGTRLGLIPYWISTNVTQGAEVTIIGFNEVNATVSDIGFNPVQTPIGGIESWILISDAVFQGQGVGVHYIYSKLNGILVVSVAEYVDPILYYMGLWYLLPGEGTFQWGNALCLIASKTNIDFGPQEGPSPVAIPWPIMLLGSALIVSFAFVFWTRRRRRRQPAPEGVLPERTFRLFYQVLTTSSKIFS